jgi:hypothetical protein
MATTTYLTKIALDQLDQAQAEIDQHVASGVDGRCPGVSRAAALYARATSVGPDGTVLRLATLDERELETAVEQVLARLGPDHELNRGLDPYRLAEYGRSVEAALPAGTPRL